jgi:hypothetical protein
MKCRDTAFGVSTGGSNDRGYTSSITPDRQFPDAIVRWNALTLDIIKAEKTSPPMAGRNLAMVDSAIYDAANAILSANGSANGKTHKVYKVPVEAPADASAEAAAVAASYFRCSKNSFFGCNS